MPSFLTRWLTSANCALLLWLPPAGLSLYIKYQMLKSGGLRVLSRQFGMPSRDQFSYLDRLSFFRTDLLAVCIVVPALIVLMTRALATKVSQSVATALALSSFFLLYVELQCLYSVGRFLSSDILARGFLFAWNDPGGWSNYVRPGGLVKMLVGLLGIVCTAVWIRPRPVSSNGRSRFNLRAAEIMVVLPVILITITAWIPSVPHVPYHMCVMTTAVSTFIGVHTNDGREVLDDSDVRQLSKTSLLEMYRTLVSQPAQKPSPFFASARRANVIFFILETMPMVSLSSVPNWSMFPNLRRLQQNSFVGINHYTTYPYTSRAIFSIFTSWYPSDLSLSDIETHPASSFPGVLRSVSVKGYATAVFSPSHSHSDPDDKMFEAVGAQRRFYADSEGRQESQVGTNAGWESKAALDTSALAALQQSISAWTSQQRPFAAVFLPQISHAPWPDVTQGSTAKSPLQRAHALLALEDKWLGSLLRTLDDVGQLHDTILVVTGDHGIRTREEDPDFQGGMIDEYSFHVPLLIYSAQTLSSEQQIPWLTSHIDIGPTVLDLLGIDSGRESSQGTAIWDPELAQRTTYFFARHYLGADGYHLGNRFFSSNMLGSVYSSDKPHFEAGEIVPSAYPTRQEVIERIRRMVALQQAWSAKFSEKR